MSHPHHAKHGANTHAHLGQLKKGDHATVTGLSAAHNPEQQAIRTRLLELGFAPGEAIRVVAESFPNRDPMAVRVGNSTFALRRLEAAMIQMGGAASISSKVCRSHCERNMCRECGFCRISISGCITWLAGCKHSNAAYHLQR